MEQVFSHSILQWQDGEVRFGWYLLIMAYSILLIACIAANEHEVCKLCMIICATDNTINHNCSVHRKNSLLYLYNFLGFAENIALN